MNEKQRKKLLAAAIAKRDAIQRVHCFDPFKMESRPSPKQLEPLQDRSHLHIYCVAGNQSGKSTIGARRTAWMFEENDPYWERPNSSYCHLCKSDSIERNNEMFSCNDCNHTWVDWAAEPLLIIVAGRTTTQLGKLWETKIKPYLTPGCHHTPKRAGGVIQEVQHKNGNTIIFTSHDKAREAAEKVQSFVAHFIWLDEMPGDAKYIEELHRRVDSRRGQFLATFTPKSRNESVRDMVDNVDPRVGCVYRMGKLDNPIYWGREEEERAKIAHLSSEEQNSILYGDWLGSSEQVFQYDKNRHSRSLPRDYNTGWAHVIATDPAASGNAGLIIAARQPSSGKWWIVVAQYLEGKAPSDMVEEIEKIAKPYNIVRRIYDPHETGFFKEARKQNITYMGVFDKARRKLELITNVQQALKDGWLLFVPNLFDLVREFNNAEWNNDGSGIQRSTKYHLLDAIQYLIDNLPTKPKEIEQLSYDATLMKAARDERIAKQKKVIAAMTRRKGRRRSLAGSSKKFRPNVGL